MALGEEPDISLNIASIMGGIVLALLVVFIIMLMTSDFEIPFLIYFLIFLLISMDIALIAIPFISRKKRVKEFEKYTENAKKIEEFNRRLEI